MALEFPQDNWRMPNNQKDESSIEGEFFVLMSLALDDMLSTEEESRFYGYMEQDPTLANEWQIWQDLNTQFDDEPSVMPSAGFVASVIDQLSLQESDSEIHVLMSLALDGMLSTEEERRFHHYLEQDPTLANEWQVWQGVNVQFNDEPSMMPPAGFAENVASMLVMQERRSKLRLGIMVGAVTTFAWLLLVMALVGAGAYALTYQGPWIGDQIENLTRITATAANWISIGALNLSRALDVTAGSYQMWGMLFGYMAASGAVLVLWTRVLRRSVGQAAAA